MLVPKAVAVAAVLFGSGGLIFAQPSAGSLTLSEALFPPELPWFALVTGSRGGVCETRVFPQDGRNTRMALTGFDATGAGATNCDSRIVTFTAGHPPVILSGVDLSGPHRVELRAPTEKRVKAWLMDCIGSNGQRCRAGEPNLLGHDAEGDLIHALYQYSNSFLGISLRSEGLTDAANSAAAAALRRQVSANVSPDCSDLATDTWPFERGSLNIYYVDGLASGFACLPVDPPSAEKNQVAHFGFIMMPVGRSQDLLAHELLHLLLADADHSNVEPTNVLSRQAGAARCNFSPEQAIRVMRIETPSLVPAGLQACADDATCQATLRLYPFSCPQEVHRTLTDWVRCLHCSEKQPPAVDALQGIGAMIFTLKMGLGGLIRVQQRRDIHAGATDVAKAMSERFQAEFRRGRLNPAQVADQEAERLRQLYRTRALKALGQGTICNEMKLGALDAFEWVLGERKEMTAPVPPSPALREDLRNELSNARRLCFPPQPAAQ